MSGKVVTVSDDIQDWNLQNGITERRLIKSFGFIYLIHNLTADRFYIGKKQVRFKKTMPPLKGYKRKRIKYIESDWRTYTGSCQQLTADIEAGHEIERFVIELAQSKFDLNYKEKRVLYCMDVIHRDEFYNSSVRY